MKKIRTLLMTMVSLALFGTVAYGAGQTSPSTLTYQGKVLQATKYGSVEGVEDQTTKTFAWLGVPYAKPPIDELRWRAPQTVDAWSGVLSTKKFSKASAQLAGAKLLGSEDCLYLNIWRPATNEQNLPVLVFVHGGGNFNGSGETFKGDLLATRTNSIIVSVNYRLGALGWLNYSALKTGDPLDDSGNYGLLDILKSLEWVQGSIESFGGNPHNVTLSGQSAGARDVMAALISPLGKGLFQKAMALSGGFTFAKPEQGEAFSQAYVKKILVKTGEAADEAAAEKWLAAHTGAEIADYLRSLDTTAVTPPRTDNIRMAPFPHLFADGYVIPKDGADVIASGNYNQVPLILGSMAREFAYYTVVEPYFAASLKDRSILQDEAKFKLYQDSVEFGGKMFSGFVSERAADLVSGNAKQPPVYVYRFTWGRNEAAIAAPWNQILGAAHAADIDFYTGHEEFPFQKLFPDIYYTKANKPGRDELSLALAAYVKNFLYTGNPNGSGLVNWEMWPKSKQQGAFLQLDADASAAHIAMVYDRFDKQALLTEMKTTLPADEWNLLSEKLLKGRFFWDY